MVPDVSATGYYSLLRWQSDPSRGESRNVAIVLVDASGHTAGMKAAPVSAISPRLHEQGLLDGILVGLETRLLERPRTAVADLEHMSALLTRSVSISGPTPVIVGDFDATLATLYRALVSKPGGGSKVATKAVVLDKVVRALRSAGRQVKRSHYVGDFLIDLVIDDPKAALGEVLSFASVNKNTVPIENDACHYLYALERIGQPGFAIVEPPVDDAPKPVSETYARVLRWLDEAAVPVRMADEITAKPRQAKLDLIEA